jgi:hypothetical protein
MSTKGVVLIQGAPRSGTSWLGQIFASHPKVAYRYQPLFAYKFKDIIQPDSTKDEIQRFLRDLYDEEEDEFILQTRQQEQGLYPKFQKTGEPELLVIKMIRYHYLITTFLTKIENLKVIGIVRHPCGAINSWLKAPREFKPEWNKLAEWREAPSKNQGRGEEYFGFEKWKEVASMFLDLEEAQPDRFYLVRYEELVENTSSSTAKMFSFVGLEPAESVEKFIARSHSTEIEDPYAVFKKKDVKDRWVSELDPIIREAIFDDVGDTKLSRFL